ncbi:MAG: PIN domain-containing protein [bacterium]|nr:PIN domain-containing protein [bacterium]
MTKVFVDTNILVYSMDSHEPVKQEKSRSLLKRIIKDQYVVISTQVLQEFYVASTRKLNADFLLVKEIMRSFKNFEVVTITSDIIEDAIDCSILSKISFWDALIISAAEFSKCDELLTEDLNHGQVIRNVTIVNPFK